MLRGDSSPMLLNVQLQVRRNRIHTAQALKTCGLSCVLQRKTSSFTCAVASNLFQFTQLRILLCTYNLTCAPVPFASYQMFCLNCPILIPMLANASIFSPPPRASRINPAPGEFQSSGNLGVRLSPGLTANGYSQSMVPISDPL